MFLIVVIILAAPMLHRRR